MVDFRSVSFILSAYGCICISGVKLIVAFP